MSRGKAKHIVRVYIWNLTHGGGEKRPQHEYRIQVTGIDAFELEPRGKTLILGWSDKSRVLAAFDASRRTRRHGKSPSLQISEHTLEAARKTGAAAQDKRGDIAVAVRPSALTSYIGHLRDAHRGDLSKIIVGASSRTPTDDQILLRASAGKVPPRIGTKEEHAQRQAIRERIDALDSGLADFHRMPANRGHNRPPELLAEDEDIAVTTALAKSAKKVRKELDKQRPDVPVVAAETRFLRWISAALNISKREIAKLGDALGSDVRKSLVTVISAGVGTHLQEIARFAGDLASELLKWRHIVS
jgi:hypothetical protein